MEINELGTQIIIVFIVIVFLWLFLRIFRKTVRIFWKAFFVFLALLVLSFVLPAVRQWVLSLF